MAKLLNRLCLALMGILFAASLCKGSVFAKEIVVNGQNIQAALDQAQNSNEVVTVTIPAGTYNLSSPLLVYSNTTIRAEGADITVNGAQTALTHSRYIQPANIRIIGGTWRSEGSKVISFYLSTSNILLENLTVAGSSNSVGIFLQSVKDSQVNGCKIDGMAVGLKMSYCTNVQISGNTITNSAETGIFTENTERVTVSGNTVKQSGKYGIWFDWENSSVIKGNTLDGCAIDPNRAGHGEGLVVQHGEGTWVEENKIYNVQSHIPNYGNGVIVSFSKSITVRGNTVVNSGNHGLQASYASTNIYFINNTVNNSGKMGISVSRGSNADLTGNIINNSASSGIVYDGKNWEQGSGRVSGTVTNCVIDGSKSEGIHIELADVTVQGTTVKNSTAFGVVIMNDSTADFVNNVIQQDQMDSAASGIVINQGTKVTLDKNRISNFGYSGLIQNPGGVVSGTNNQVMVNANKFGSHAIFLRQEAAADKIRNNSLFIKSISGTEVTGQNYWPDFECGAVVNGVVYPAKTGDGGYFTIKYPQTDSSKVVVFVKDPAGNAIILQAPADFDLNKVQSGGQDQETDTKKIENFVKRMYRITLDREADADGLQYYVSRLQNGEVDGATVAQSFVGSPEFQNKKLSQENYLKALYSAFFDRAPADSEIVWWKNEMASGRSRKYVLSCFVNSPEFLGVCESAGIIRGMMVLAEGEEYEIDLEKLGGFVDRLYEKALKRPSESDGRQYYIEQISTRKITAEQAAKNFFFSPEFEGYKTSDQEYIERLYLTFMGRASEPDGMYYWLNKMRGGMTREQVLSSFAASQEFKDILKSFGIRY